MERSEYRKLMHKYVPNLLAHEADAQRALDAELEKVKELECYRALWKRRDDELTGVLAQLATLQAQADHTRIERNRLWGELADLQAQVKDRDAMILQMGEQAAVLAKENMAVKAQLRQVEGERNTARHRVDE